MIIDEIVKVILFLVMPVLDLLPVVSLGLPAATSLAGALAGLDSLVPVLLPLQIGAGMLAALGTFVAVRVVVFLLNLVIP